MESKKPAKTGQRLMVIRRAMSRSMDKYTPGGRENPKRKPITLRQPRAAE